MSQGRRNHRFRDALQNQGLTMLDLAAVLRVNFKTVQRWYYEGRVPHAGSREHVGRVLQVDPKWLWPTNTAPPWAPDLTCVYASLSKIPPGVVGYLARTSRRIDVACDDLRVLGRAAGIVISRAGSGASVRFCGAQWIDALAITGVDARWATAQTTYAIFRFDGTILLWLRDGSATQTEPAEPDGPVLHLTRADGSLFDVYQAQFDRLWRSAHAAVKSTDDWLRASCSEPW